MDAIVEASGVSKATIYKHWADKDALCLEVMAHLHGLDEEPPAFDSGDLRTDLIELLRYQPAAERAELKTRMMPHLMAYSARKPDFGKAWRSLVMDRPRTRLKHMLKRAVEQGLLRKDLNYEVAIALLIGPMMYRHIFNHLSTKLPDDMPEQIVDSFWRAHATDQRNEAKKALRKKPGQASLR
jgi:AcrR family transcriptional regulator